MQREHSRFEPDLLGGLARPPPGGAVVAGAPRRTGITSSVGPVA
jgi:hypothetical protein